MSLDFSNVSKGQEKETGPNQQPSLDKTISSSRTSFLALQRIAGNWAVQRWMRSRSAFQPKWKLAVDEPANTPGAQNAVENQAESTVQKTASSLEITDNRREDANSKTNLVSPIYSLKDKGKPLTQEQRIFYEPRFRHDLSRVRIHTDASASATARDLGAHAFTLGNHIVFAAGQYLPDTPSGQRLLAHELAHTIQQRNAIETTHPEIGHPRSQAESEARLTGSMIPTNQTAPVFSSFGIQTIQREPVDNKSTYAPASNRVFQEMSNMSDEVARLRAVAPPANSPGQEAQRTFAIIRVLDENGNVKQSVTGEFFGKGPHAEERAISKLNLKDIGSTDRVLVVTDQWPCEEKCSPALQKLRQQTKGEFRVFSKAGVNEAGTKVVRSPKTEAKKPGPNPKLVELEEFHRSPTPDTSGPAGGPSPKTGGSTHEPSSTSQNAQKAASTEKKPSTTNPPVVPENEKPTGTGVKPSKVDVDTPSKTPGASAPTVAEKPFAPTAKTSSSPEVEKPSMRPRVTIEGQGARPRVNTGGWKWAGRVGTGASIALGVYGAISMIDEAVARVEEAQTGSIHPEIAKAMAAVDRVFPDANDLWKDKFSSWQEDKKYLAATDWLITNGMNTLMTKSTKDLEIMGDHLNTLYWYHQHLDDLEFDLGKLAEAIAPIEKDVEARTLVLNDIAQTILKQIDKWPNDTAQLTLWGIYTTFNDASGDMGRLRSQTHNRLLGYNHRRTQARNGKIESARLFNYYAGIYAEVWAKVTNKKVLRTKISEE